eukprot:16714-Chlamydomonas_euryale.AAC.5
MVGWQLAAPSPLRTNRPTRASLRTVEAPPAPARSTTIVRSISVGISCSRTCGDGDCHAAAALPPRPRLVRPPVAARPALRAAPRRTLAAAADAAAALVAAVTSASRGEARA